MNVVHLMQNTIFDTLPRDCFQNTSLIESKKTTKAESIRVVMERESQVIENMCVTPMHSLHTQLATTFRQRWGSGNNLWSFCGKSDWGGNPPMLIMYWIGVICQQAYLRYTSVLWQ